MTELYVSDSQVVVAHNGASALFQPGVARPLRNSLIGPALSAGVRIASGGPAPTAVTESTEPDLTAVIEAIRELMAEGDPKAFGVTGEPKLVALRKKLGAPITDALRDDAWRIVQAGT